MHLNEEYGIWVPTEEQLRPGYWRKTFAGVAACCGPFLRHLRGRDCVVQAGGHVGVFPKYLAARVSRVLSFEASPVLHECLRANCGPNVTPHNLALGACAGVATYYEKDYTLFPLSSDNDRPTHQVRVVSIDGLRLEACDGIFLDIERGELDALRGAQETVTRFRPVIQVEWDHRISMPLEALLRSFGYAHALTVGRDRLWLPVTQPA
jgi:FkbM family methyltransferase